jgi:hypothetical protein
MFRPILKQAFACLMMLSVLMVQTDSGKFLKARDYQELATLTRDGLECQKLCIGKVLTKHLKSKQIRAEKLCAEDISSNALCSKIINTERLCANVINATQQICAPSFNSPLICAESVTADNICVRGTIKANDLQQCGRYRATTVYSSNQTYTLGENASFDLVIDDPNGDIISNNPTIYEAPLSGYYMITLQFDITDVEGDEMVLGIPVSNVELLINGNLFRQTFSPFLGFHNVQNSTLSGLLSLKAGDLVSARYNVFVMSDTGFMPYIGTCTMLGNGSEENASMLKIHYLSSDCESQPCEPCNLIPCTTTPCALPCSSCVDCPNMSCCEETDC